MTSHQTLVTGSNGFVGRHLIDRLLLEGRSVVAVTTKKSILPEHWLGRVEMISVPNWHLPTLRDAVGKLQFDHVFHLAAYGVSPADRDADTLVEANIELPRAMAQLCQEWKATLVATGSCSEYATAALGHRLCETDAIVQSTSPPNYAATKAAGGVSMARRCFQLGVASSYLRLFNVFGAGEAPHRLLPSLVEKLRGRQRVPLSHGAQIRDFIHVNDVIEACIKSEAWCVRDWQGETAVWNVCTGHGSSVREFATMVATILGCEPGILGFGDISIREGESPWVVGDPTGIHNAVGWRAKYDLQAGIAQTLRHLDLI